MAERLGRPGRRRGEQRGERDRQHRRPHAERELQRQRDRACERDPDHERARPRERAIERSEHGELGHRAGGECKRRQDSGLAAIGQRQSDARSDQRRGERRQERDVVRMKDPVREAEHDRGRQERAADRDQPAGARIAAAQPGRDQHAGARHDREAEQPPGLVTEARLEQAEHARPAAEQPPPPRR